MQGKVLVAGPMGPPHSGIARFQHRLLASLGEHAQALDVGLNGRSIEGGAPAQVSATRPRTWQSAAQSIRKARPDAVVFNVWTPLLLPAYARLLAALGDTPTVAVVHSFVPRRVAGLQRSLFAHLVRRFAQVVALEGADPALVPPHATWLPHPVERVVPGDRAAARHALGLDPDRPVVLFFGFVRQYKGLDVLLEAFARHDTPEVILLVAGQHVHRYAVLETAFARAEGLRQAGRLVVWDRPIPEAQVPLLFAAADVVALPYRTPTSTGVGALAVQHGRPVVVSDLPALAPLAAHHPASQMAPAGDAAALAAALERSLSALAGGAEASNAPPLLTWNAFAQRLLQIALVSG